MPPSRAEYFDLLADIEGRLHRPVQGSPPVSDETLSAISEHDTRSSAILLNRADHAIAAIAYVWLTQGLNGHAVPHRVTIGSNASVLLPFGMTARQLNWQRYWNTILPGSKRLLSCSVGQQGDNSDVRPPASEEIWNGGEFVASGSTKRDCPDALSLTLDGVFFEDGGYAGPNTFHTWEQITLRAEAFLYFATLARQTDEGSLQSFYAEVDHVSGVNGPTSAMDIPMRRLRPSFGSSDPEVIRQAERTSIAASIQAMRSNKGESQTLRDVRAWADAPVPKFHKL